MDHIYDTSSESKTFDVDSFELNIEDASQVSGKLYAMDHRRDSGYYFTLYPLAMPQSM